ncbi:glycosyl transferase family 2 [Halalkalicoccus paucihalophilus]|jgi:glycosyltransferase involved in cell wall biosynthesis|uniref:Glycosyl transferase family 2 n=1 Tax=Halalkalicoccus paucihalophilus TaxID=1008153 RepID=A0A151AIP6_9EURY|nr:glycosyltransferase family 2 protein [Halalkalicoccus paucihalophilus]KYH27539.1 glycosyl transferase family 2 [Halalkalicoccus paucihalophilus]
MSSTLVTVALPSLNEQQRIGDCLDSIAASIDAAPPTYDFEVLVLDSYSDDDTVEIAQDHPVVDCVDFVERGILKARHRGFELADGEVCVAVDADSYYPPAFLTELLAPFEPGVSLTYGPVEGEKQANIDASIRLALQYGLPLVGLDWVSGSNRAIRTEDYFAAGGYRLAADGNALFRVMIEEQLLFPRRLDGRMVFAREAVSAQSARTLEQLFFLEEKEGGVNWNVISPYESVRRYRERLRRD